MFYYILIFNGRKWNIPAQIFPEIGNIVFFYYENINVTDHNGEIAGD